MRTFEVPVAGGSLSVTRWGSGPRFVLGLHGLTGTAAIFAPVARHLGDGFSLVAPDLRGRGASAHLPPPFGLRAHATDAAAVIEALGDGPVAVLGVSLGAFISEVLAASRPDLVERLVWIDCGLPLELPAGMDVPQALAAIVGPSLERLSMTFPSREAYLDFWRPHPALAGEWSEDIEAFLLADLAGREPGLRASANPDAVAADAADELGDLELLTGSLRRIRRPVHLMRAPRDVLNREAPLQPDSAIERWGGLVASFTHEWVEDTNHYTIALGERGAKAIAERLMSP